MSLRKGCGWWKAEVVETAKTDFSSNQIERHLYQHQNGRWSHSGIVYVCMYAGRCTPQIELSGVLRIWSLSLSWAPLTDMMMIILVVLNIITIMKMIEVISQNSCLNNHIYLEVLIHLTKFWRLQIFWQVRKCLKYWNLILFCLLKPTITWLFCVLS